jgi:hypothetical protein
MGAAIAAAVITAAATGYGAYEQNKASKRAGAPIKLPGKDEFDRAYGDVPHAALFQPVDIDQTVLDGILASRDALPEISKLMRSSGNLISKDAINRASALIPNYRSSIDAYGSAANSLLKGEIPYEDVLGIINDRAGLSGTIGIPGTATNATLKDLGLSRLDAIKTGGGMFQDLVNLADKVSPRSNYITPKDFLISPQERVQTNLLQNQLMQQSQQSAFNLAAEGDPSRRAELEAQLGVLGQTGGGGGGSNNAAYAQAATQLIGGLGQLYNTGYGMTPYGGYNSRWGANNASTYGNAGVSYTPEMGYVPIPQTV